MTQKYVIGNWKLNPTTLTNVTALTLDINIALTQSDIHCLLGVAPSFVHLSAVKDCICPNVYIGSQDISHKTDGTGAFTGDISAHQIASLGANFTLIGHSERRQYHNETADELTQKISHAFKHNLSVIYCIGETKDEYEQGITCQVLEKQLAILEQWSGQIPFVDSLPKGQLPKLIIAYEPVWAIGTGLTPTFDEIETVHGFIGEILSTLQVPAPILYGGSVNDKNAPEFAKSPLIDGALVGGASLKAESFLAIAKAFS